MGSSFISIGSGWPSHSSCNRLSPLRTRVRMCIYGWTNWLCQPWLFGVVSQSADLDISLSVLWTVGTYLLCMQTTKFCHIYPMCDGWDVHLMDLVKVPKEGKFRRCGDVRCRWTQEDILATLI